MVQGFGRRADESGCPTPEPFLTATEIESPLARNGTQGLTHLRIPSPFPWRRNSCAWDCKVTPVYCTCQEGNTIGCIPSNDGLDARLGLIFPHALKIHGVATFWVCRISAIETCARTSAASHYGQMRRSTGGAEWLRRLPATAGWIEMIGPAPGRDLRVELVGGDPFDFQGLDAKSLQTDWVFAGRVEIGLCAFDFMGDIFVC